MWQSMGGVYHNNQNETSGFLQHMPIQVWISPGGWSHHSPLCWSNPDSLRHGPPKKDGSEDGKTMETMDLGETPQWNVLKWCRRNNQFSCLQHVDIARSGVCLSLFAAKNLQTLELRSEPPLLAQKKRVPHNPTLQPFCRLYLKIG